jgi:hypothetical protein
MSLGSHVQSRYIFPSASQIATYYCANDECPQFHKPIHVTPMEVNADPA